SHTVATPASRASSRRRLSEYARRGASAILPRHEVAHTPHRADKLWRELAAQMVNVYVDRIALDFLAPGVEPLRELLARQHPPRVQHQRMQQGELARRQIDGLAVEPGPARGRVELDLRDTQHRRRFPRRAADQRTQARGELVQVEWLHQ